MANSIDDSITPKVELNRVIIYFLNTNSSITGSNTNTNGSGIFEGI